jgi:hypothetical protein
MWSLQVCSRNRAVLVPGWGQRQQVYPGDRHWFHSWGQVNNCSAAPFLKYLCPLLAGSRRRLVPARCQFVRAVSLFRTRHSRFVRACVDSAWFRVPSLALRNGAGRSCTVKTCVLGNILPAAGTVATSPSPHRRQSNETVSSPLSKTLSTRISTRHETPRPTFRCRCQLRRCHIPGERGLGPHHPYRSPCW